MRIMVLVVAAACGGGVQPAHVTTPTSTPDPEVSIEAEPDREAPEPPKPEPPKPEPPKPEEERTPDGRRIVYGTELQWCSIDTKYTELGSCQPTKADCEGWRAEALKKSAQHGACGPQPFAVCFDVTRIASGNRWQMCWPSVAACEMSIEEGRKDPDAHVIDERCYVYRMRKPDASPP